MYIEFDKECLRELYELGRTATSATATSRKRYAAIRRRYSLFWQPTVSRTCSVTTR